MKPAKPGITSPKKEVAKYDIRKVAIQTLDGLAAVVSSETVAPELPKIASR